MHGWERVGTHGKTWKLNGKTWEQVGRHGNAWERGVGMQGWERVGMWWEGMGTSGNAVGMRGNAVGTRWERGGNAVGTSGNGGVCRAGVYTGGGHVHLCWQTYKLLPALGAFGSGTGPQPPTAPQPTPPLASGCTHLWCGLPAPCATARWPPARWPPPGPAHPAVCAVPPGQTLQDERSGNRSFERRRERRRRQRGAQRRSACTFGRPAASPAHPSSRPAPRWAGPRARRPSGRPAPGTNCARDRRPPWRRSSLPDAPASRKSAALPSSSPKVAQASAGGPAVAGIGLGGALIDQRVRSGARPTCVCMGPPMPELPCTTGPPRRC